MTWSQGYHDFWLECEQHNWWWADEEDEDAQFGGRLTEDSLRTQADADRKKAQIFQAFLQYNRYGGDLPQKGDLL